MHTTKTKTNVALLDYEVSYGLSVKIPENIERIKLNEIFKKIKSDKNLKVIVDRIKSASTKEEKTKIKSSSLPYFSMCKFNGRRSNANFIYTEALIFDIDNLSNLDELRAYLEKWEYTSAVFTSPSGKGLKLIVKLNRPIESNHQYYLVYQKVLVLIQNNFNVGLDVATKDPARATFLSYDPNIFYNEEATSLNIDSFIDEADALAKQCNTQEGNNKSKEIKKILNGAPEGERHNSMIKIMGSLIKKEFDKESVYKLLDGWNQKNLPPMSDSEFAAEFEAAYRSFTTGPKDEDDDKDRRIVTFWSISRGTVDIDNMRFIEFLEQEGFRKIMNGPNNYELVKLNGNIISRISIAYIQEYIRAYMEDSEDLNMLEKKFVLDKIIKSTKTLFVKEKFNFLKTIKPRILKDEKNEAYLFFNNQYLKITPDKVDFYSYDTLHDTYIWDTSISDHSIQDSRVDLHNPQSEFDDFLNKITKGEEDWYQSLICSIGYMMHNYKNQANAKAIIFCDEEIPTANAANGGTGKSLVSSAFTKFKKTIVADGKNYKSNRPFNFQMIDIDTKVVILDDVRKDFDFESLLSAITSNLIIEKKGKDPITIPFSDAPKFIITTNYTIDGTGNSFDRRKHEIEFSNHYNKFNTPDQEFGRRLFEDWDEDEWNKFYSSIIYYIQQYLINGLVKYKIKNLWQRKIINGTSVDFFDFAENNIEPGKEYTKRELLQEFKEQYPEYDKLKSNTLTKWIKIYAENMDYVITERRSNKNRYFTFAKVNEVQKEEVSDQDPKFISSSAENSDDDIFPFLENKNDINDSPMDDIF